MIAKFAHVLCLLHNIVGLCTQRLGITIESAFWTLFGQRPEDDPAEWSMPAPQRDQEVTVAATNERGGEGAVGDGGIISWQHTHTHTHTHSVFLWLLSCSNKNFADGTNVPMISKIRNLWDSSVGSDFMEAFIGNYRRAIVFLRWVEPNDDFAHKAINLRQQTRTQNVRKSEKL